MSYRVLRGLYFGESSNADLLTGAIRARLHIKSGLDELIPGLVAGNRDVVLTGNPGDGKSHLVSTLGDAQNMSKALIEGDLSAAPVAEVVARWRTAASRGQPYVLCANEGPLVDLLRNIPGNGLLAPRAAELRAQLGRLTATSAVDLPDQPSSAVLIDLADRNLLEHGLVASAFRRVCNQDFLPQIGVKSVDTSAGRNLLLFAESAEACDRMSRLIVLAGRRLDDHITYRQLWGCIAYALGAAKAESTLRAELSAGKVGLGTYPLDNLCSGRGEGALIRAIRNYGDPANEPAPTLDAELWASGAPRAGRWFIDDPSQEPPERLWHAGRQGEALSCFASLKRLVAVAHEAGSALIDQMEQRVTAPGVLDDLEMSAAATTGIRRNYLTAHDEARGPSWLHEGVPLWIGHTYRDVPISERPHVVTRSLGSSSFSILRPTRVPWLVDSLGPAPEVAWLVHQQSGITLRIDSNLLAQLQLAQVTSGPLDVPERVSRFLSLLSGWHESQASDSIMPSQFAVIGTPRSPVLADGSVVELDGGVATYAES